MIRLFEIKRCWLKIIQFLVIFLTSALINHNFLPNPDTFDAVIIIFFVVLYLSSIYEIPVKYGIKQDFTKKRIILEVIIVWMVPMICGYMIGIYI